jgi:hypothetical protein
MNDNDFKQFSSINSYFPLEISTFCSLSELEQQSSTFGEIFKLSNIPGSAETIFIISISLAQKDQVKIKKCLEAGIGYVNLTYTKLINKFSQDLNIKIDANKSCISSINQNLKLASNNIQLNFIDGVRYIKCVEEIDSLISTQIQLKNFKITMDGEIIVRQLPFKPSKRNIYLAGAIAGILMGLGIGLIRYQRRRIKNSIDIT